MTEPTQQDIDNANRRQAISDHFRKQYEDALALAEQVLGAGWKPTGQHHLIAHTEADRCRRSGERPVPAATVYTAEMNGDRRHFTLIDGQGSEVESCEAGFGPMLTEPDTERTIEVKGQRVHPHKYGLYWAGFEADYKPQDAAALAAARAKREAKAVDREASGSLFADEVRAEGYVKPPRKGKPR